MTRHWLSINWTSLGRECGIDGARWTSVVLGLALLNIIDPVIAGQKTPEVNGAQRR